MTPSAVQGEALTYPTNVNLHSYLFSNPFQHSKQLQSVANFPNHSFDGQAIPLHRPLLVHDRTNAVVSWERARADSLRLARYLSAIVGSPISVEQSKGAVIHSPRTTVLIHLPNCIAFPLLMLGGLAARLTVCPISSLLEPRELAYLLARSRPHVLVTSTGVAGEHKLRAALQLLLDTPSAQLDDGAVRGDVVLRWAAELADAWDAGKAALARKGELRQKVGQQRVWTVDLDGGADYYGGSALQSSGRSVAIDLRDWTHMLTPPAGAKVGGAKADAYMVPPMTPDEQRRRVAILLWSSGTTGKSKGVLISHTALIANTAGVWASQGAYHGVGKGDYGGGERWVCLAPFNHIYGLATLLLPSFAMGSTLIFPASPRFELGAYLDLLTRYRATWGHIAPQIAVSMPSSALLDAGNAPKVDLRSVRGFVSGGAPVPTQAALRIFERTGRALQLGYGATETCSSTQTTALLGPGVGAKGEITDDLGSCGPPLPNVEIRIVAGANSAKEHKLLMDDCAAKRSKGARAPLDPCAPGEIQTRGPALSVGYASGVGVDEGEPLDTTLNKAAFTDDGWYRTGDEGCLDRFGNIWITGRSKECIKVKGFQVSPSELDDVFTRHPAVREAAATGALSGAGAEVVELHIVPSDSALLGPDASAAHAQEALARELARWCENLLAHYKWPAAYVFRAALPRNAGGKLLRKELGSPPAEGERRRRWDGRKGAKL